LEYLPGVSNARNFPPEIIKELKEFLVAGWFGLPAPGESASTICKAMSARILSTFQFSRVKNPGTPLGVIKAGHGARRRLHWN